MPKHIVRQIFPIEEPITLGEDYLDEVLSLWFQWRGDKVGLPDWKLFQPFKRPHLLPFVSVAKREEKDYRFVLVGEAVRERLPIKLEGKLLCDAMPRVNADDVRMRMDRAIEGQLPNFVEKTMAWLPSHAFIQYRMLQLPFSCEVSGHLRILSVADFEADEP